MEQSKEQAQPLDPETLECLAQIAHAERAIVNRVAGVRTVLVVLSSFGMVFDFESLRQKILRSYPDTAVFFRTANGDAVGPSAPKHVDLLIDLTAPGTRQPLFYAKKLRRMARVAVGRKVGLFRHRIYDRIFSADITQLPKDRLDRERLIQKEVLDLAGVVFIQSGDTPPDRGKTIARELPS